MNQNSRRAARAIAVARADESRSQKALMLKLSVIALCAVAALTSLPAIWSF